MLFDHAVVDAHGLGNAARAFNTLKHTLFLAFVQDVAKLALDSDKHAPSIANIVKALADAPIRKELQEKFAVWELPAVDEQTDPLVVEALKRIDQRKQAQRMVQFDELHQELVGAWQTLSTSPASVSFLHIRNRVSAHAEIRQVADQYVPVDIGKLGLKWGDVRATLAPMQRLVELCSLLVRNTSFAWDSLDRQLTRSASGFWHR